MKITPRLLVSCNRSSVRSRARYRPAVLVAHFLSLLLATFAAGSNSNQVEQLAPLAVPRTAHTATVLNDGRVLIVGGRDAKGNVLDAAEIFDPGAAISSKVAPLHAGRVEHTATLLKDGRVLILGGKNADGTALSSAEMFDPAMPAAGFTVLSSEMGVARSGHTATLLNSGKVLIAGGDNGGTAEIFDPTSNSFSSTLFNMAAPRTGHSATLFSDDTVLLAGGGNDTMETFNAADQSFTLDSAAMSSARSGHEAIPLSDTRLLLFGGDLENTIEELNFATDPVTSTPKGSMDIAASSATLLANGKILVLRPDVAGLYSPDAADPASAFNPFSESLVSGSAALLRKGQTATELSADKRILVAGGENADNQPVLQLALFNPAKIWTDKDDYLPAEPVLLYGSGWKANENVYLYAVDSETEQWTYGSTAHADGNGSFSVQPYFIVEMRHLGTTFDVTAVGAESEMQADVSFTDASFSYSPTVTQNLNASAGGAGASFSQTVTSPGSGSSFTAAVDVVTQGGGGHINASWVSLSPNNLSFTGASNEQRSWTVTIAPPAGTAAGTYTGTIKANASANGVGEGAGTPVSLTVTGNSATSTAVTSSANPSTYGTSVTFTATVTSASSTPTGSLNFIVDGSSVAGTAGATTGTTAKWTYTTSALTAGNHSVSASYAHTGAFQDSSGSLAGGGQVVNKANATATLSVSNSPQTYTGAPKSATVGITTSSVPGSVTNVLTGAAASQTNAGTYAVTADFVPNDTTNYNTVTGLSAGNFVIGQATPTATLAVNNSPQSYSGSAKSAAVGITTSSVPGSVTNILTGGAATQTNAGTYAVTADFVPTNNNYKTLTGLSAGNFVISQGSATVTLGSLSQTYDGTVKAATATTTPVGMNVTLTYTQNGAAATPKNAGSYTVVGTINDANYSGSATGTLVINKAAATVTLSNLTHTYDGSAKSATATTTPAGLSVTFSYDGSATAPTNAGTYAVVGTINDSNYSGTANGNLVISKASATVTLLALSQTYDGAPKAAGATTTPTGLSVSFAYSSPSYPQSATAPTNAGSYSVTATINDTNHSGSKSGTLIINKATATVTLGALSQTYNGAPRPATATTTPTGLSVSMAYDGAGTAPTHAGSYTVVGTVNDDNYSGSATGTLIVGKANASINVDGYNVTYDGNAHSATGTAKGVANEALLGLDLSATTHTSAGTYSTDAWSFKDVTGDYNDASGTVNDVIGKADASVSVQGFTGPYDGDAHGATGSVTGVKNEDLGGLLILGEKFTNVPGGTANWSFSGSANYKALSGAVAITITKVNASVNVQGYTGPYDGNAHGATGSAAGVKGESLSNLLHLGNSFTNVPGGTASWTFDGNGNYNADSGTVEITLSKVNATVSVQGYHDVYDGHAHGATGTATGVKGENLGTLLHLGATFTNVPGGTAEWTFDGDGNYNATSGSATIVIDKADATITVNGYTGVYDGAPHGATGTATGVAGESLDGLLSLGAKFTNVPGGTADWAFAGNGNYNGASGHTQIVISKADAHITVSGYEGTYDGAAHGATGSASGVENTPLDLSGLLNLGGTFTNYPGGTAHWIFAGNGNYNNASGDVAIKINKAAAHISVQGYSGVYDGAAHGATGSASGVEAAPVKLTSLLHLGSSFTNVPGGTAHWTFDGNNNYLSDSGDAVITITKADAHITVNGYSAKYDGNPHGATGSASGVEVVPAYLTDLLSFGSSYTDVPGGTAHWSFAGNGNYNSASGDVAITITKADASITVTPYHVTYNGSSHTAAGTATGVKGEDLSGLFNLSGTTHTNAGTFATDAWSFAGNGNYNAAGSTVSDQIDKANATIKITPYSVTYDGDEHMTSGTVTGVGGASDYLAGLDLSGTKHTGAGDYTMDNWAFTDVTGNYNNANGTVHDSIAKAKATIQVTPYAVTYDGNTHTATGTATGVKGEALTGLNLTGTTNTNAGSYPNDGWSFSNANYEDASGTVNDSIAKANAKITVSGYSGVYDGYPHSGSGSAAGVETPAPADLSGLLTFGPGLTKVPGGSVGWTFVGNNNYNAASGSVAIVLGKANPAITVTPYSVTYDTLPHTATFTVKGVLGENLDGMNVAATTHTNAGTYNSDPWTFTDVTGNYNNASGTVKDCIGRAALTITADPKTTQYSDPVTFSATYAGFVGNPLETPAVLGGTLVFTPTASAAQFYAPGGPYTITPSGLTSSNYAITFKPGTLTVNAEDARAYYTGFLYTTTSSATSSSATVTLSATIKDITAETGDPAYDQYPGDIRNATVTFVQWNGAVSTPISPALPVGLVSSGDTKVGTVTYNWGVNISGDEQDFTIGVVVSGNYSRNASSECTVVTVAKPIPGSINGGGYLVEQKSSGLVPGAVGTKNNFGFNVKNASNSPKGTINTIIRNNGRVYQIKGNAMTSLTTKVSTNPATTPSTATFNGKANIQDITNPVAPISVDGNASLQVVMSDRGEPGGNDSIAITVWNKSGGLWFSSNWNGTQTAEQTLGGGNLQVR